MLDIQLIRRDPDAVRAALSRRGPDVAAGVDRVLELDDALARADAPSSRSSAPSRTARARAARARRRPRSASSSRRSRRAGAS